MKRQHSFRHRVSWDPQWVGCALALVIFTAYLDEFPLWSIVGVAFVALWFGLSVYDAATSHRLLDWLYPEDAGTDEKDGRRQ